MSESEDEDTEVDMDRRFLAADVKRQDLQHRLDDVRRHLHKCRQERRNLVAARASGAAGPLGGQFGHAPTLLPEEACVIAPFRQGFGE